MRKLIATEGNVLTQSAEISLEHRIFTKELYLAVNDSPDNWKEIPEKEAAQMQVDLQQKIKD